MTPETPGGGEPRTVVVILGTDHHPFDRLVSWSDQWVGTHPDDTVIVQHGHSRAPAAAAGAAFFDPVELRDLAKAADAVITHGGPGSIADARAAGHLPLVVPRDPDRGEHVDGHQQRFARWAASKGLITLVEETAGLEGVLRVAARADLDEVPTDAALDSAHALRALLERSRGQEVPTGLDATAVLQVVGPDPAESAALIGRLGGLDGVVTLGDVGQVWQAGLLDDGACSCGARFSSCVFWSAIGERAFGGWASVDPERVPALLSRLGGRRRWELLTRHPSRQVRVDVLELAGYWRRVYDAAREVAKSDLVVDSSTEVATSVALSHDRHIDLRVALLSANLRSRGLRHRRIPVTNVDSDDLATASTALLSKLGINAPGDRDRLPAATAHGPSHLFPG